MNKIIGVLALVGVLTACPSQPPVGTALPSTGGTVNSSDTKASFVVPIAGAGTFVNVTPSSDQGQIPNGQTLVSAYNFAVIAGSVASATVNIQVATPVVTPKKGNSVNRLYKRDGTFWRYVEGQTNTSTSVSAVVSSYGVYGVLSGIATIKDIIITPNPVVIDLNGKTSAVTQQMTAVERDSLDQPVPSVDSSLTWVLGSQLLAGSQLSPQLSDALENTIDNTTGLLTARVAVSGETIIASGNQNKTASVPLTITGSLPK
jgi:hypothetical protein